MPKIILGKPDNRNITPLTIRLRVHLRAGGGLKPGDTGLAKIRGQKIKLGHVSVSELDGFKARFQSLVPQQWSNKIFIVLPNERPPVGLPAEQYRRFASTQMVRWNPCVLCKLEIELTDQKFDWRVDVVKPLPGEPEFPSFMVKREFRKEIEAKGMPHGMLTLNDLQSLTRMVSVKPNDTANFSDAVTVPMEQVAASHEVGHMLGLHHVNHTHPICSEKASDVTDSNDPICYGDTVEKAGDMMGYGSEVRSHHGQPWLNVIMNLTGHKQGWTLTTDPRSRGCATPETFPEIIVAAGKQKLRDAGNAIREWRGSW